MSPCWPNTKTKTKQIEVHELSARWGAGASPFPEAQGGTWQALSSSKWPDGYHPQRTDCNVTISVRTTDSRSLLWASCQSWRTWISSQGNIRGAKTETQSRKSLAYNIQNLSVLKSRHALTGMSKSPSGAVEVTSVCSVNILLDLFWYACVFCLHVCAWWLCSSEEGVRSLKLELPMTVSHHCMCDICGVYGCTRRGQRTTLAHKQVLVLSVEPSSMLSIIFVCLFVYTIPLFMVPGGWVG